MRVLEEQVKHLNDGFQDQVEVPVFLSVEEQAALKDIYNLSVKETIKRFLNERNIKAGFNDPRPHRIENEKDGIVAYFRLTKQP